MVAAVGESGPVGWVSRKRLPLTLLFLQILLLLLFSLFTRFQPRTQHDTDASFASFQSTHVSVVLGFALLTVFLKRYSLTSLGFHLLIAALVLQWGILVQEILLNRGAPIILGYKALIGGDFAVLSVMISFGAVAGKLGPLQLTFLSLFQVIFSAINIYVGRLLFQATDAGNVMFSHVFGAYFGIAVSRAIYQQHHTQHPQETRTYLSNIGSIIGTLLLWVCFPGLNGAMAPVGSAERVALNTVLALAAATISTFFLTTFLSKDERFSVAHMQNAALSGGIGMSGAAHLVFKPYGAILIGILSASVSVFGISFIKPFLERKKVTDTRGVLHLHGLPGILGALVTVALSAFATYETYGIHLFKAFPAMIPRNGTENEMVLSMVEEGELIFGEGRTPGCQAGVQAVTLLLTVLIACVGGLITGLFLRLPMWDHVTAEGAFDDGAHWEGSEEGMPSYTLYVPPLPIITKEGEEEELEVLKAKEENEEEAEKVEEKKEEEAEKEKENKE